jgi:flagellar biosynthesis component FlhA
VCANKLTKFYFEDVGSASSFIALKQRRREKTNRQKEKEEKRSEAERDRKQKEEEEEINISLSLSHPTTKNGFSRSLLQRKTGRA